MTTAVGVRDRILLAAEEVIATQGPSASLREIATVAGQRNNSAVHYHFGSRDALIEAVVEQHQRELDRARAELLLAYDAEERADLRSLVQMLVGPMFTAPYAAGSTHYARFLEKVRDHPAVNRFPTEDDRWVGTKLLIGRIDRMLVDLPTPVRHFRLRLLMSAMFAFLADLERTDTYNDAIAQERVIDALTGLISAPEGIQHR